MGDKQLEELLRQSFAIVNGETNVAGSRVLERCVEAGFKQAGADWWLDTADRFGLVNAASIRENLAAWLSRFKTEQGQSELKEYVAVNAPKIKQHRRVLTQLIRLSGVGERGIEFSLDSLPDNGGVYRLLTEIQKDQEGGRHETGNHNHPSQ